MNKERTLEYLRNSDYILEDYLTKHPNLEKITSKVFYATAFASLFSGAGDIIFLDQYIQGAIKVGLFVGLGLVAENWNKKLWWDSFYLN